MRLEYHMPRPDLRDYVRIYYYFSTDIAADQPFCAELGNIRILLSGGGRIHLPGGRVDTITAGFVLGPTMGAYRVEMAPGTCIFGIGVRPRGWSTLLGISAAEMTDAVFDFSDFAGKFARRSVDELGNAKDLAAMAGAADSYFAGVLERRRWRVSAYPQALEQWLLSPDDPDIDSLIDMMDVSRRQTDRLAKQAFGASPKLLQRKYRALRAADRIRAGAPDWMTAAGPSFYDQSHFIKEFKTFIGVTPQSFAAQEAELISAVQLKRKGNSGRISLASL